MGLQAFLARYRNGSDDAYEYTYDDNGNITSITKGTTSVTYEYNGANELIRENNGFTNQTVTYTYDSWGNLTEKSVYAYTTAADPGTPISMILYGYTNTAWGDQLTSYDGQTIVYDAMGNPTTYRGKALTWRGKQLTGVTAGTDAISYGYDENGLRLQKTVNNVVTDYYYNGKVLIGLVKGNDTLRFSYDAAGNAAAVNHNGTYYYYLRNGQGDIVKLIDGSGATVVEYIYDSWGKPLSCTGTLATTLGVLNPFRYRGYVYDEETQWYYLKSRYYDPETCRFISADVLLSTGQGVIGHNTYVYCGNNPIGRIDESGQWWIIANAIVGAVFGAASQVVSNLIEGKPIQTGLAGAIVGGAVSGAVLAVTGNITAASYAGAAAESMTNEIVSYIPGVAEALNAEHKDLTMDNVMGSAQKIVGDTIVYGTIAAGAGKVAQNIKPIKTNHGWFKPKKVISSFVGKYAIKQHAQTAVQAGYVFAVKMCDSLLSY